MFVYLTVTHFCPIKPQMYLKLHEKAVNSPLFTSVAALTSAK